MKHIKIYEDYSDDEIRSLLADMKSLDLALTDDEKDMLEFAAEPAETGRLSCQIPVTDALDGMVVRVPAAQY